MCVARVGTLNEKLYEYPIIKMNTNGSRQMRMQIMHAALHEVTKPIESRNTLARASPRTNNVQFKLRER